MNIDVPVSDDHNHGSQQAVDATIVSPVARAGEAQPGADVHPGWAVEGAARRKRHQTYPELVRARLGGGRAAWVARWSGLLAVAAQRAIAAFQWELPVLIR